MKIHTKTAIPLAAVFAVMLMVGITPAFAEVTISAAEGSGAPGCEETADGCYLPGTATVDVGGMVIMSNPDTATHTFTAGSPTDGPTGEFDTGLLMAGGSFEYSPNTAGEIPYFCMVHPWMKGTIIVQEAGAQMGGSMMDDKMMMSMKMDLNEIMAEIKTSDGMANEPMTIDLTMTDLEGNGIEHITYKIKATQGSEVILDDEGHMHKGTIMNTHMTSALPMDASETMPIVLSVESVGFGHDDLYVDVPGEIATKQVVPEFGTIAVMILAVAIISIIAVSARSRLSIMPRL
ncbi:MAG: PEFG-CTERM sorting domain-containing protein [Nitrosopumilus sp.]|nr:PEFG-CTERM sorting domain-containing protein [Nitrosopumilus sp.]